MFEPPSVTSMPWVMVPVTLLALSAEADRKLDAGLIMTPVIVSELTVALLFRM